MNLKRFLFLILISLTCLLSLYAIGPKYLNRFIQARTNNLNRSQVWQPKPGTSWYIQLEGQVDISHDVDMYEIDLFYVSESNHRLIDELHQQGKVVICYFSAGTWENWRSDRDAFDSSLVGNTLGDWPDEKWLNIQQIDQLAPIMRKRLDMAVAAHCDGVLPDNVDGYTNNTGFTLDGKDQIAYNKWLAEESHSRGLSIGLHNDVNQVKDLVADFDWAANEQCFYYSECGRLSPFVTAGKAVFTIEYEGKASEFCPDAQKRSFSRLHMNADMRLDQDALIKICPK